MIFRTSSEVYSDNVGGSMAHIARTQTLARHFVHRRPIKDPL